MADTVADAYTLSIDNHVLEHGLRSLFLHDGEAPLTHAQLELKALVRSGDYFATLATTLDNLSKDLGAKDIAGHEALEKVIDDLLYLQKNYQITTK